MKRQLGTLATRFMFAASLMALPAHAAQGENLALTEGTTAAGDSYYFGVYRESEHLLIDGCRESDGICATCWASEETPAPHWVTVNFPRDLEVGRVRIYWARHGSRSWAARHFSIQSWDGKDWQNTLEVKQDKKPVFTDHVFPSVRTSRLRILQHPGGGGAPRTNLMWVGEVEAYAPGVEPPEETTPTWLSPDQGLPLQGKLQQKAKMFYPKDSKANFTSFAGMEDVVVEDGVLKFTLAAPKVLLAWGNYKGQQPLSEVKDMFDGINNVRIKIKQSAPSSTWRIEYWTDGKKSRKGRRGYAEVKAALSGTEWRELVFPYAGNLVPTPDGLGFGIEAPKGTRFEIEYVKMVQSVCDGYFRKEFVLPKGNVWRAIADVGGPPHFSMTGEDRVYTTLYINGKKVERRGSRAIRHTAAVDIAPYLQPGKNCVAFHGHRIGGLPTVVFHAKVVLESGTVTNWRSDDSWKYSGAGGEGWNTVGYDDSSWTAPGTSMLQILYAGDRAQDRSLAVPAYKGRLVIKNPAKRDLFYMEGSDVMFEVHTPAGLASQEPGLEYVFSRVDAAGATTETKRGKAPAFKKQGASLVSSINVGKHPKGVYTVALTLKGKSGVIAERPPEPVMVMRRFSLKEIEGKQYNEGLDLELEDTVDFTNPDDPHPWIESESVGYRKPTLAVTTPAIVRTNGLVYRETASNRGSFFGYRIEFKHPGSLYLLELDYPDDAQREIEVSVSDKTGGHSQSGVGAETGGRFYLTGKMQTLSWPHMADSGVHSFNIVCSVTGQKAAAKALRIYRIKGDLPSVGAGTGRMFGIHTERCSEGSGFSQNLGFDRNPQLAEGRPKSGRLSLLQRFTRDLVWMQETCDQYVQYLKFAGQNTHIIGCYQYGENNTSFAHPYETDTARLPYCLKSILANALDVNDITFYAGIQWSKFQYLSTSANDAQVARGQDTIWMVDAEGKQFNGYRFSVPNWLHPRNRTHFADLMEETADKFRGLSHFRGVHYLLGDAQKAPYYLPGFAVYPDYDKPFTLSYDDITFAQFEKDTGVRLDVAKDDPARFGKRRDLVLQPKLKDTFVSWRCQKVHDFMADGLGVLRTVQPDLEFMSIYPSEAVAFFKYWVNSGRPYKDVVRDLGFDLDLLTQTEGLWLGRWTISWRSGGSSQNPYCWIPKVMEEVTSAYNRETHRYVLARTSWDENAIAAPGVEYGNREPARLLDSDWIVSHQSRVRALLQPSGFHARETVMQALISADPDALMYGFNDANLCVGHEQEIREFAKVFTHLPKEKFETLLDTGFESNLVIRRLSKDGQTFLYVANPGYWQIEGTLKLAAGGKVYDLVSGQAVTLVTGDGATALPVSLAPFGLAAFRVDARRVAVPGYSTSPISAAELSHMEGIMGRVSELLADEAASAKLSEDDRAFLTDTLGKAKQALQEQKVARAWSLLTHWRFWSLWKDSLEPA